MYSKETRVIRESYCFFESHFTTLKRSLKTKKLSNYVWEIQLRKMEEITNIPDCVLGVRPYTEKSYLLSIWNPRSLSVLYFTGHSTGEPLHMLLLRPPNSSFTQKEFHPFSNLCVPTDLCRQKEKLSPPLEQGWASSSLQWGASLKGGLSSWPSGSQRSLQSPRCS